MPPTDHPILFVDHPFPEAYRDLVLGRATVVGPDDRDMAAAVGIIAGARRPWDHSAFALGPLVRVISRAGIGYDNVNVADAHAAGIVVCNAPDAPTVSTAEHTIALMMAVGRGVASQQDRARAGLPGEAIGSGLEFDGLTLGLIGFGRIARRVAAVGRALGMRVIAHDPFVDASILEPSIEKGVELMACETVMSQSDVLSLHCPATTETRHLINANTLGHMKRGVLIINCARGTLIDQDALLAALDAGHVRGAGLDVTDPEPLPLGHPLLTHPKVVVTPHIASSTEAGRRRLYEHAIENALNVLAGRHATVISG
jgi:D-3-phosphoglycerate dehydrogenase / 2-oxoglutarate reductase